MLGRVPINAAAVLLSRIVAAAGGLAIAFVVVDRLGTAAFGRFAAILAIGAIANVAQTFGVDTMVVRAVADRRPDATVTVLAALRFQLLIAAGVTSLTVVLAISRVAPSLLILPALALFPLGFMTVASAVIRGVQQMTGLMFAGVLSSMTSLGLALLVVSDQVGEAVVAVIAGQTAGALFLTWRAFHHFRLHIRTPNRPAPVAETEHQRTGLLAEAWVFAAATLATAILIQGSIVIFKLLGEGSGAGLAAGLRLVEAARLVPAAAFAALFPAMFDGAHRTERDRRSFRWLIGYAVLATGGLMALAPWFVRLFFDALEGGATVIRVLALSIPITVFRLRYSFELIAAARERTMLAAAVPAVGVAVSGYVIGSLLDSEATVAWFQVIGGGLNVALLAGATWRESPRPVAPAQP